MLSSIFTKTKPINFIIIKVYLLTLFLLRYYKLEEKTTSVAMTFCAGYIISVISILILHFLVRKYNLSSRNLYSVFFYVFLIGMAPEVMNAIPLLISSFFVVVGTERVCNLRNEKAIKSSILEASICYGMASVLYFWSISFMIVLFIGMLFFAAKSYKNWIISLTGLGVVYIFVSCYMLFRYDHFLDLDSYIDPISINFEAYKNVSFLFTLTSFGICLLFFMGIFLVNIQKIPVNHRPVAKLIIFYVLIAVFVVFIAPIKNTTELVFLIGPMSVMGTTYMKLEYSPLVREINLGVFLLLPFVFLFF
ncbi:hypothetical protein ACFSTE_05695 [Aquimarina hainanensis]|uniref:Uncharacterized protein n=1 Tax=Aquimarina hainanensis TaxID=1578017 RepID=A0ABW5N5C5_9FLAO